MGADLSRSTFKPAKRYTGVRQQQGRVNLDADWNEQVDIAAYRLATQTRDIAGRAVAPRDAAGFALTPLTPAGGTGDLILSPGRLYVEGRLCELSATAAPIQNFTGDGTAAAGTQVQLASTIIDNVALQQGAWVEITAQGTSAPAPLLAQVTAVNAAAGSVTLSTSVAAFEAPNTNPQIQRVTTYLTQPDLPSPPSLPTTGSGLVYLDIWERTITSLVDPAIQEIALGGADTATRTKDIWQLKVLPLPAGAAVYCSTPDQDITSWQTLTQPSAGLLSNGLVQATAGGACTLNSGAGFSGMTNQLYRVEIHQPGAPSTSIAGPLGYPLPAGTATFKWSRDNASVATAVTGVASIASSSGVSTSQLTVSSTGRDAVLSFSPGDWVEVTDDSLELNGQPGELHQVDVNGVDQSRATITLTAPLSTALAGRLAGAINYHPRVTRWDQGSKVLVAGAGTVWVDLNGSGSTGDIPVPPVGTTLVLENGITVAFGVSSTAGLFAAADTWSFAARSADGSIEPLNQAPPTAVRHHYARLGIVNFSQPSWVVTDCRLQFAPLADPGLHVTSVSAVQTGALLLNDSTLTVQQLGSGIVVVCDGPIDPSSLLPATTDPANAELTNCTVTVGMPVVSSAAILGFQPLTLSGAVSLDSTGTTIKWSPALNLVAGLSTQMTAIGNQLSPVANPTLLARLTLKGNSIWSAYDQNVYLDGECLTAPYLDAAGVQHTGLVLPSGDGRRGGDFSTWFWLTSPPAPPALTVSATSLSFATTPLNVKSQGQIITLTNTSSAAVPATFASSDAEFAVTSTCAASVPPNSSCTITVIFTPTQAGNRTGTLTITTNVPNPPAPIALSGVGVAFQLSALPSSIDFGAQNISTTSAAQTITLYNGALANTTPIVITGITTATPNYVHSTSCGSLAAGQSCTISVQFAPQTAGAHPDSLTIATTPPNLVSAIPLAGTGTQPKNTTKENKDSKDLPDNKQIKDKPKGYKEMIVKQTAFAPLLASQVEAEVPTGTAFIQADERPAVGQQALTEPKEPS